MNRTKEIEELNRQDAKSAKKEERGRIRTEPGKDLDEENALGLEI